MKFKAPSVSPSKAANRPSNFAPAGHDVTGGPGQYDAGKKFGEGVVTHAFGQKRDAAMSDTPGPGTYSPEKNDETQKFKAASVALTKSPQRPSNFAPSGHDVTGGPG